MASAEMYVQENNLHITNEIGKEWNWDIIDANKDSVVNEAELVEYLVGYGALIDEYAKVVAKQLMAHDTDGAVTFSDLQEGVDEFSDFTSLLVREASVADESRGEASVDRTGGHFALYYNEESQSYQWAIRASNGRYYDVVGSETAQGENGASEYWDRYRTGKVGIEFDESREVDASAIFRPGQGDAQMLDTPPEFAQSMGDEDASAEMVPANGSWYLVDGLYVFVESKKTSGGQDYLDVHIFDDEGATVSSMTGDPHVNEVGGDENWDWHYTSGSTFQIGDLLVGVETSDLNGQGENNTYNTEVVVRTADNHRLGKTVEAGGAVRDTADSDTMVFERSRSLLDGLDLDNVNGHTLAFLVFLDANETLNGVLGDILKGLAERNRNIDDIRDLYGFVNNIKAREYNEHGEQSLSYEEFSYVVQANQLTGGQNQELNNYYVDLDVNGDRVIFNRATGEAIDASAPPEDFPAGWTDHVNMTKDELNAMTTSLEQAMQEQTGEVELMMTRVKNFLTKQEAFVGATGGVTQGQKGMYDRASP